MFKRSKRMIQSLCLVSVVSIGIGQADSVSATSNIGVTIDGNSVYFPDARPTLENGRVSIPVRVVTENMGIIVDFNHETQEVTFTKGSDTVVLTINKKQTLKNGKPLANLDVPPKINGSRTYVPLRFIGEAFGATVDYLSSERVVRITLKGSTVSETPPASIGEVDFKKIDEIAKKHGHRLGEGSMSENFGTNKGTETQTTLFMGSFAKGGYTVEVTKANLLERQQLVRDLIKELGVPITDQLIDDINSFKTMKTTPKPISRNYGEYKVEVVPATGAPYTLRIWLTKG